MEEEIRKFKQMKDFYQILGVAKSSTQEEIRKAYKKLALKFHPDKNPSAGAQDVFKKISQAYDCLSNEDKKASYDRYGSEDPDQQYQ